MLLLPARSVERHAGWLPVTTVNAAFGTIVGQAPGSLVGTTAVGISAPLGSDATGIPAHRFLAGEGEEASVEIQLVRPDGEMRTAMLTRSFLPDRDGGAARVLGMTQDVTESRRIAAMLRERELQMHGAIEASLDALFIYTVVRGPRGELTDFEIAHCNARAGRMVGMPQEDLIGHRIGERFPLVGEPGLFALYEQVVIRGEAVVHDYETFDPRVSARWVRLQIVRVGDGLAVTARDITDERHYVDALEAQAHIDDLTGLLNRRGFLAAAQRECQRARREDRGVAVICLDLDSFKQINDRHGHSEGDAALRTMADVLRAAFRGADVVGRLGGDEFMALVVPGGPAGASMEPAAVGIQVCERIAMHLASANAVARASGCGYEIRTSMGTASITTVPGNDDGAAPALIATLLQAADAQLYAEKRRVRLVSATAATDPATGAAA